jgi:hypothetical protein
MSSPERSVNFKRVDGNTDLPLPADATADAAGMELRAFLPDGSLTFKHGQFRLISTGFRVALPPGVEMQIRPRPGLALKHSFMVPNSPGTVDEDYRVYLSRGQQRLDELERVGVLRYRLDALMSNRTEDGGPYHIPPGSLSAPRVVPHSRHLDAGHEAAGGRH